MSEHEKENREEELREDRRDPEKEAYRFMDQTIKKRPVSYRTVLFRVFGIIAAGVAVGLIASLVLTLTQPALREKTLSGQSSAEEVTIPPDEDTDSAAALVSEEASQNTTDIEQTPEVTEEAETADLETAAETGSAEGADTDAPAVVSAAEKEEISDMNPAAEGAETQTEAAAGPEEDNIPSEEDMGSAPEDPADAEQDEEGSDTSEEQGAITLQEYRQLYKDMMSVADQPEHALVQVIGITSELDYFNRNYENQRRISGLVIAETDKDLFILTEYRVVEQVERIQVVFCDGAMTDAIFQKADQSTGLAILKVPLDNIGDDTKEKVETAPLGNSYKVERGEPVLALGSPLGYTDSIAYGIVTSAAGKAPVADTEYALLTTDIDGSPDGSGILINLDGEVIGVITNKFGSGTGSITCLAISQIKGLMEDLSNNEERNYAGILTQEVTQDITDRTGIPRGLLVTGVEHDSPAMLAGIKEFDVIVKIGERAVMTKRGYYKILQGLEPGEAVEVTAMRRGTEGFADMTFELTVESR